MAREPSELLPRMHPLPLSTEKHPQSLSIHLHDTSCRRRRCRMQNKEEDADETDKTGHIHGAVLVSNERTMMAVQAAGSYALQNKT